MPAYTIPGPGAASGYSQPSGGGGGSDSIVTPPSPTSQSVAAGGSLSAKTFGSFTDPDGVINNYVSAVTNAVGSASVSGSGLGAYTFAGTADGNSGTLSLTARNAANESLATATHSFSIGSPSGGVTALLDISGVSSYNFKTQGGSGGSGGAGPHSIAGKTFTLDFRGTSGPTKLLINNGVIEYEGSSSARAQLVIDLGVDVSPFMFAVYCSIENVSTSGLGMLFYVGEGTSANSGNQAQFLAGSPNVTTLLMRENTTSSPAFVTVKSASVTDINNTPTRMCCQMLGGAWQPSFDQGTAALPTDGAPLGAQGQMNFSNAGTAVPENRKYVILNLVDDCDVRVSSYKGSS